MVVESPAKAKTIGRYLGEEYRVLASYGHVIDLPAREGYRAHDRWLDPMVLPRREVTARDRWRADPLEFGAA